MFAVTIDGVSSKDLDDAVWCVKRDNGYLIQVLVSNVADHITLSDDLDGRARAKQFSIYSGNRGCVNPMLPRPISEGKLSLLEGKSRNVVVHEISLDASLNVTSVEISTSKFINEHRLDPATILSILQNKEHPLHSPIALLSDVATKLLEKRRQAGSLAIYDIFSGWACDEDGVIRKLSDAEKNIGYVIVQEFMVLTNSITSEYCIKNNIPIMYRNHKVSIAAPAVTDLSKEIQNAFTAQDEGVINLITKRLTLFAGKAVMGNKVDGHYGLNLPSYAYFTSPIRRYPDLVNQRNILAHLRGEPYPHDQEGIEQLANDYNNRIAQVQQETADHHALKARERGEGHLDRQSFTKLDGNELHQVIKIFVERSSEDAPEMLQAEILRRVTDDTIEHKTLALLFSVEFAGFSLSVKESVIAELKAKPHLATSISNILMQKFGMAEVEYDYKELSSGNIKIFQCEAKSNFKDKIIYSGAQFSGTKKIAGQFAVLDVLQQIIGVSMVISEIPADYIASLAAREKKANATTAPSMDNPVGALQELCQKNKYSMPLYDHTKVGPDHMPSFSATVTVFVQNRELISSYQNAVSKKEAAKMAAMNWINTHHLANGEA